MLSLHSTLCSLERDGGREGGRLGEREAEMEGGREHRGMVVLGEGLGEEAHDDVVPGLGFRVWGLGLRVYGLWFRF